MESKTLLSLFWKTCHSLEGLACEQFWLDLLLPDYNLCKIAGNTQGVSLSEETKAKLSLAHLGKTHTLETRQLMSESRKGSNAYWYGKTHSEETRTKLREVALSRTKLHLLPLTPKGLWSTRAGLATKHS